MKYLYTLLLLTCGLVTAYSQTQFLPPASQNPAWYVYEHALITCLGDWCYFHVQVNKYTIEHQASTADSIYLLTEETVSANYHLSNHQPQRLLGTFTVKPSGAVYFMPNFTEYTLNNTHGVLMYSPAAEVGDTVEAGWVWEYNGSLLGESTKRSITLVDTISMAGEDRKRWEVGPTYDSWWYIEELVNEQGLISVDSTVQWIEGIGSNQGPYYNQFDEYSFKQLLCYEELGDTLFRLVPGKPCDLGLFDISSTHDLVMEQSTDLYPNPSNHTISIGIHTGEWDYQIINPMGVILQKGTANPQHNRVQFDLPNGTYFLVLRNAANNTYISKRFVVAN